MSQQNLYFGFMKRNFHYFSLTFKIMHDFSCFCSESIHGSHNVYIISPKDSDLGCMLRKLGNRILTAFTCCTIGVEMAS